MPNSLLELQDLYNEALVRETIEKTKSCGLLWSHLGGNQFQAQETINAVVWDFFITKTQIGNLTYKYTFDVKKNSVAYITIEDGPLPFTERDSVVKDLYEMVEITVLQIDARLKETLDVVKGLDDCAT